MTQLRQPGDSIAMPPRFLVNAASYARQQTKLTARWALAAVWLA
jgi:hypothetical protein